MFKNKILIIIFILALLLRFIGLGSFPSGFDADEAAFGYNTYSLIKTGGDEYGNILPLSLKSFGEYKPALYSYLSIPFVLVFDLNSLSVRFVSALFGSLTVVIFYLLAYRLSNNNKFALIASLILAISPWHINLSRTVSEVIISLFFNIALLYSLFNFRDTKKKKWLAIAALSIILSILSYTASRFFVPLLIFLFLFFSKDKDNLLNFAKPYKLLIFLTIGIVVFYTLLDSANRIKQISIFETPQTKLILEEQIRENQGTPIFLIRAFHNKIVNYSRTIVENYANYFTLDYLFLEGGQPQRMKIPDAGLFYLWQLPFLIFGLYLVLRNRDKIGLFMLLWWLISLIPVSFTFDEIPNVYRSAIIIIPVVYILSLGIFYFYRIRPSFKSVIFTGLILLAIWELLYYGMQYLRQDMHRPWYRGYAYKELVDNLNKDYDRYEKFVITKANSSPYIYILFYSKYDPKKYQKLGSPRDIVANGGFDKFLFSEHDCPSSSFPKNKLQNLENILFIDNGSCKLLDDVAYRKTTKLIKVIDWKDGTDAFKLLEHKPLQRSN